MQKLLTPEDLKQDVILKKQGLFIFVFMITFVLR